MNDAKHKQGDLIQPFTVESIAAAARLIADGQCVAVPTETVYGLAADATNGEAVARIYEIKGRPSFNPLIVHVSDTGAAQDIAIWSDKAQELANAYWPGPLTLVLPLLLHSGVSRIVTAGLDTIAIRCPAHPAMQALLKATGKPLAAPSANASGSISPTRASHVAHSLEDRVPLIIDAGPCVHGLESTIIAIDPDATLRLLRPGPIDLGLIVADAHSIEAPGQLESHYAPSKPLRLNAVQADEDEWLIGFGEVPGDYCLSEAGNLVEAASRLFDALHQADSTPALRIAVAPIPQTGLGAAINDRLRRAAS